MNKKTMGLTFALMLTAVPAFAQDDADRVMVRLIHAVPDAPAVTVSVGASQLFSNIAFKQITAFTAMPKQDDKTLTIKLADGRELKTTEQLSFDDDDQQYTILVTPDESGANPKIVILEKDDETDDIDQDEVQVTLINADPAQKSIKLLLNDDTEARGVNYAESDDNDVDPGQYTMKIVGSEGVNQTIAAKSVGLVGGIAVTVLVTGQGSVQIVNDAAPEIDMAMGAGGAGIMSGMTTTTGTSMMSGATTSTQPDSMMTSPGMSM